MQWEKAQAGDTSMLIWRGKVMCGQRETSVVAMTGPNGGPNLGSSSLPMASRAFMNLPLCKASYGD